jgi:hypothetical protein
VCRVILAQNALHGSDGRSVAVQISFKARVQVNFLGIVTRVVWSQRLCVCVVCVRERERERERERARARERERESVCVFWCVWVCGTTVKPSDDAEKCVYGCVCLCRLCVCACMNRSDIQHRRASTKKHRSRAALWGLGFRIWGLGMPLGSCQATRLKRPAIQLSFPPPPRGGGAKSPSPQALDSRVLATAGRPHHRPRSKEPGTCGRAQARKQELNAGRRKARRR